MKYFSLLYPTQKQELSAQSRNDTKLFYHNKTKLDKQYKMVGNKLVLDEKGPAIREYKIPCFYKDLNLDVLQCCLYPENGTEEYDLRLLQLAADQETVYYRQHIMRDLEMSEIESLLYNFCLSVNRIIHYKTIGENLTDSLRKGKYLIDMYCTLAVTIRDTIEGLDKYADSEGLAMLKQWLQKYFSQVEPRTFETAFFIKKELESIAWEISIGKKEVSMSENTQETVYSDYLQELLGVEADKGDRDKHRKNITR